jgi:hypothetical protein
MIYKASLDKLAKWITGILFLVFISIGIKSFLFLLCERSTTIEKNSHLLVLLLLFLILFFCWLYAPIGYIIDDKFLIIKRRKKNISIDFTDITSVKLLTENEIKGGIRMFGVGGVFGYFGLFTFPKIGYCKMFATQRKNMILIETLEKKKFIITPDELKLINDLKEKIEIYR